MDKEGIKHFHNFDRLTGPMASDIEDKELGFPSVGHGQTRRFASISTSTLVKIKVRTIKMLTMPKVIKAGQLELITGSGFLGGVP